MTERFLAEGKVRDWLDRYDVEPTTDATFDARRAHLGGARLGGRSGTGRGGHRRRPHRRGDRGLDRPAGGVDDGARRPRRVRRHGDQPPRRLARVLRRFPPRARRPAPPAVHPQPRPARAAQLLDLAVVLQPRRDLLERAARLSAAPLPRRAPGLDRHARPAPPGGAAGVARLAAGRGDRVPPRVPRRPERAGLERHRRGLLRRGRRPSDRERTVALRQLPRAGGATGLRGRRRPRGRARAHPDERALRVGERARRHLRAGLLHRLSPRLRALRLVGPVGRGIGFDELPAAHFTALLFDVLCLVGLALVGRRLGGLRLAATLAFAWAAYPFTQYASSSNTNDTIMPAFLIWGFLLASRPAARGAFLALAGWTKFAALLLLPLWARYSGGAGIARPLRGGLRRSDPGGVLGPAARAEPGRGRADLRRAHRRLADRARLAVLDLGLGPVPGSGRAGPRLAATRPRARARGRRGRARVRPRRDADRPGGVLGRAPRRLPDRADALVVPLHPLVLPVRRRGLPRLRAAGARGAEPEPTPGRETRELVTAG